MALVLADRVRETTTTTGTGTVSLAGPVSGFQGFSTAIGNANTTYYTIADAATGAWEVGLGTYTSSGSTLARTTILSSSNSGAAVNFAAGTKDVFVTQPAERALYLNGAGTGIDAGVASFTANGVVYASSTSALATNSALTFDGTNLKLGTTSSTNKLLIDTAVSNAGNIQLPRGAYIGFSNAADNANSEYIYANGGNLELGINANTKLTLTATSLYTASGVDVGIGTSSPDTKLDIDLAAVTPSNSSYHGIVVGPDSGTTSLGQGVGIGFRLRNTAGGGVGGNGFGAAVYGIQADAAANTGSLAFYTRSDVSTFSERMFIASGGNVGIGTSSPAYPLEVYGSGGASMAVGASTGKIFLYADNSATTLGVTSAIPMRFSINSDVKMYLTSAGNLGLGVTPSAWRSGTPAFQIGSAGICLFADSGIVAGLGNNMFLNSSSQYIALREDLASRYQQYQGVHSWLTAPSVAAGAQLTFSTAMTLDASGNLGIGATSPSSFDAAADNLVVGTTSGNNGITIAAGTSSASTLNFADGTAGGAQYTGYIDYQHNGDFMRFGTNGGSERARITSDGTFRVKGAGTAGSTDAFQVAGTAPASVVSITSGGNLIVGTTGSSDARLYVRGAGTTSATASFEASNSAGSTRLFVQDDGTTRFFGSSGSETARITSGGDFLVGATSAYVSTFSGITAEGKTSGVGNNLALGLFKAGTPQILDGDVLGNIYFYGADNDVTPGNNNIGARIASIATSNWTTDGTTSNAALVFYTHGTTSGAPEERARITSAGNLLVGTTTDEGERTRFESSSAAQLALVYPAVGKFSFKVDSGRNLSILDGSTERARISSDGTFRVKGAGTAGSTDAFQVAGTAPADAARITSGGDLLVGTTSTANTRLIVAPASTADGIRIYSPDAAGSSYSLIAGFHSGPTLAINITTNGNVTNINNSYGAISDAKLKENVTDATPKLDKLNQVRIVNFNMIGDEQKQLGVIAQELEQIFPGMVDESPDRDQEGNDLGTVTKSVKYSVFVPMLIKAIQEQQAIITALTARVAALEAA